MNRKRMIYVGVLALAVIAFVVDRVFLGEPESAYADEPLPVVTKAKTSQTAKQESAEPIDVIDPTLDRLAQLPEATPVRDVFSLSGPFLARQQKLQAEAAKVAEEQSAPKVDPAEEFAKSHSLQSTMVGKNMSMAVIDGKVVRKGETFDGFRLVHIDAYEVKFVHEASDAAVELTLPSQPK